MNDNKFYSDYRIIKYRQGKETFFKIAEVFYDPKDNPLYYYDYSIPITDCPKELKTFILDDIALLRRALLNPILDDSIFDKSITEVSTLADCEAYDLDIEEPSDN